MTAADYPVIGNSQYYTLADTTGVTPGGSGSGVNWDYSGISPKTTHRTATYVTPSSIPSGSCCAAANISYSDDATVFAHYKTSATDSVELIGDRSLTGTAIVYTDPPKIRDFPFNLGDSYVNTLNSVYFDGIFSNATRSGTMTVTYDASGTLKTPFADYSDVLRVHTFYDVFDSSHSGLVNTDYYLDLWEYYQNGKPLPIFIYRYQIVIVNGATPQITKEVLYADSMVVGVDEPLYSNEGLTLYPNPSSQQVYLGFDAAFSAPAVAEVYDITGRKVLVKDLGAATAGRNSMKIDIADLKAGAYLVVVKCGDTILRSKLIAE